MNYKRQPLEYWKKCGVKTSFIVVDTQLISRCKNVKKKCKVHFSFIVADAQLIKRCNKDNCSLLCFIDVYSRYAWLISLKDK